MTRTLPDALAHFAFGPSPQMEPITDLLSMIHELGRAPDTTGYLRRYGQEAYEKHRLAEVAGVTPRTAQRWWNGAMGRVTPAQKAQGNAPKPNKVSMALISNTAKDEQEARLSDPRTEAFINRLDFLERKGATVIIKANFVERDSAGNITREGERTISVNDPPFIQHWSADWHECLKEWRLGNVDDAAFAFTAAFFRAFGGWSDYISIEDVVYIDLRAGYHSAAGMGGKKTA